MNIKDNRLDIGRKVRQERLKQGWTQEELAERIDMCASFVGQIERGVKTISMETLERLSRAFGLSSADFFGKGNNEKLRQRAQSMEQKVLSLLRGYELREQEAVYRTLKYLLRQNRKLHK